METNFSSERSEALQASSNIVDSLLFQALDQVDMEEDFNTIQMDFIEKVLETKPAFSPVLSSEVIQPAMAAGCWLISLIYFNI